MKRVNTILIVTALFLYVYGYKISYILYNADGLIGEDRQQVLKGFWNLRFSLYSVIIGIILFVSQYQQDKLNKALLRIGLAFASYSVIDKLLLNQYDLQQYDKLFILFIVLFELFIYKIRK